MSVPDYLNYNSMPGVSLKSRVIPKVYFPEQNNYNSTSNSDRIIRFKILKENAFWDPYTAYLKVTLKPQTGTVPTAPNLFPLDIQTSKLDYLNGFSAGTNSLGGAQSLGALCFQDVSYQNSVTSSSTKVAPIDTALQLDGSIHSLWQAVLIKQGNDIVEENRENDIIANFLKDLSYAPHEHPGKQHVGINSIHNIETDYSTAQTGLSSGTSGTFYPCFLGGTKFSLDDISASLQAGVNGAKENYGTAFVSGSTNSPILYYSRLAWKSLMMSVPSVVNRVQELNKSYCFTNNLLTSGEYTTLNTFSPNNVSVYGSLATVSTSLDTDSSYSSNFSIGGGEFMFTSCPAITCIQNGVPTVLQGSGINQPLQNSEPSALNSSATLGLTQQTFVIPLLSSFLGVLMPFDRYKMIPMHAFSEMIIELWQNPYAFFTSYFGDNAADRQVNIAGIELHANIVEFADVGLNNAVIDTIFTGAGLSISSTSWYFCKSFPVTYGAIPKELICTNKFDSLKMILIGILSSDYKDYTCYRKQFRLSHCISELQLKFGDTYFPSLPYRGNASTNLGQINNYEFYYNTLMLFNKQIDAKGIVINPSNFAVDNRAAYFNFTQVQAVGAMIKSLIGTFSNTAILASLCTPLNSLIPTTVETIPVPGTDKLDTNTANPSLQGGMLSKQIFRCCGNSQMINYYENKVIGRALFGIDLEQSNYMENSLGGFSTVPYAPWSIVMKQGDTKSSYNRGSEIYVFGNCDVTYYMKGTKIIRNGIS